jgi:hypothetical protein
MKNKKRISIQMFDIKPSESDEIFDFQEKEKEEKLENFFSHEEGGGEIKNNFPADFSDDSFEVKDKFYFDEELKKNEANIFKKNNLLENFKEVSNKKKNAFSFAHGLENFRWIFLKRAIWFGLFLFFLVNFGNLVIKGIGFRNSGLEKSQKAFVKLAEAQENIKTGDFEKSYIQFKEASESLSQVAKELDGAGIFLTDFGRYIPFFSKASSGKNLIVAGENISKAGVLVSDILKNLNNIKSKEKDPNISYLEIFEENEEKLREARNFLDEAQERIEKVNINDVPSDKKDIFLKIKTTLPEVNKILGQFLEQEKIIFDILGGNGPRKYLFLFQNNQEMRATGGFIGSYGLLDIFNGKVRNFFIDGIYNPDGQLKEKIVPPTPIQKISANWSLHDSNWFPDFPKSAEKAIWFYEKTGGPTVDGVIAITPDVIQKMLEITGPINMEEYGVIIDKDNFIQEIQYEVELNYDKELNQPKKILSDLTPKVLERIISLENFSDISKVFDVLLESLNQKHILIYSRNWEVQEMLSESFWSGEILNTPNDYLSVINTNINGFKTDGVISEKIYHKSEIQNDGTIINTVKITREHTGGDTPYDWWNRVNANYMRVYVPKGSRLISAEGQTREFNSPPLDYKALNFKKDSQIQMEEDSIIIDEESGTRIYDDSGKTVFANWTYVSPKEKVTIEYVYVLPFKIDVNFKNSVSNYSLLVQKQSGSFGSDFVSEIIYPDFFDVLWQYPEEEFFSVYDLSENKKGLRMISDLKTNKFIGMAFTNYD